MILTILACGFSCAAVVLSLQSRKYRARAEAAATRAEAAARESAVLRETQP